MSVESLFAQWRVVNDQANEAERRLFEASLSYLNGKGKPPSDLDRAKAAQLRSEARTLFARALQQVDRGSGQPSQQATQQAGQGSNAGSASAHDALQ